MKRIALSLALIATALFAEEEIPNRDLLSETLGHLLVRHLGNSQFELNLDKVVQGIRDERDGLPSPMTEEDYEKAIFAISEQLFEKSATDNLSAAQAFLQKQAQDSSIQVIEEGHLHYHRDREGSGATVAADSMPLIYYHGTLLDGTVFASSQESDQPIALPLQQTISGFAKGLVGMREGEKRTLYVHPDLAYGVTGHLPPNSLLIFEVEIVKAQADPTATIASDSEPAAAPVS